MTTMNTSRKFHKNVEITLIKLTLTASQIEILSAYVYKYGTLVLMSSTNGSFPRWHTMTKCSVEPMLSRCSTEIRWNSFYKLYYFLQQFFNIWKLLSFMPRNEYQFEEHIFLCKLVTFSNLSDWYLDFVIVLSLLREIWRKFMLWKCHQLTENGLHFDAKYCLIIF